jgi:hypothetical protein
MVSEPPTNRVPSPQELPPRRPSAEPTTLIADSVQDSPDAGAQQSRSAKRSVLLAAIPAACVVVCALGVLGLALGMRDTWERDNASKLAALRGEAEAAFGRGQYQLSFSKSQEILAVIGARQLKAPSLRATQDFAARNEADCQRAIVESRLQRQQEAKREAEEASRGAGAGQPAEEAPPQTDGQGFICPFCGARLQNQRDGYLLHGLRRHPGADPEDHALVDPEAGYGPENEPFGPPR